MALKAVFFDVGETLVDEDAVEHLCVERLSELPEVLHGI